MRVADGGTWLVRDRIAGEQDAPRPFLVFAHRDVIRERQLLPDPPWGWRSSHSRRASARTSAHRGARRCVRGSGPYMKSRKNRSRRPGAAARKLAAVHARNTGLFECRRRSTGASSHRRDGVLTGERARLPTRAEPRDCGSPRGRSRPPVSRGRRHRALALAPGFRRPSPVNHDDLHGVLDELFSDRFEAANEIEPTVFDWDQDGDHRQRAGRIRPG